MSVWGGLLNGVRKVFSVVPYLKEFRSVTRYTSVFRLLSDIVVAALVSVSEMNPAPFIREVVVVTLGINQSISSSISVLQGDVELPVFVWQSLGIFSRLWLLLFVTAMVSKYLKKAHFSNNVPIYQLYLVVFVLFLTPISMLGEILSIVITTGKFTLSDLGNIGFWPGLQDLVANLDIWLSPLSDLLGGFGGSAGEGWNSSLSVVNESLDNGQNL